MHATDYTLITGASSGMGEATAKLLSTSRNLVLHGRDEARLAAVGEACARNGADVALFPFDLEKADTVGAALTELLKARALPVEAFVHFAGMTEVLPMAKTKYSVGLRVMNVNYFSAAEIISALLKKKVNGQSLRNILLTSSIAVITGKKYQPHYCGSKGAINALGITLANELAPNIRVNVIAPGSFPTRIVQTTFVDAPLDGSWNPSTLLHPGTVDDVARIVRFLISEDASYLTGQIINVDGGEHFPHF
ncbi:SDR family oxidoreductase [Desulfovibrio sp. ZJ369]|uniref:SDR family NAD(P)-dependent oxidoreductase n=1 Tax=Desulfovibrio sp. ZJ369 TaxID=2709793 RepID=UPI0013ECED1E|nr:SDR family oxidoreductase [Desulfovibrio sp. ZJ369]